MIEILFILETSITTDLIMTELIFEKNGNIGGFLIFLTD